MALIRTQSSMFTKDQLPSASKSIKLKGTSSSGNSIVEQKGCKCFCSFKMNRKCDVLQYASFQNKGKISKGADLFSTACKRTSMPFQITNHIRYSSKNALETDKIQRTIYASESSTIEQQLEALNSYLSKLQTESHKQTTAFMHSGDSESKPISKETGVDPSSQFPDKSKDFKAEKGVDSVEYYLRKLKAIKSSKNLSNSDEKKPAGTAYLVDEHYEGSKAKGMNSYEQSISKDDEPYSETPQLEQSQDETSDLYLICGLASINIAVFLFEIASPVKNSGEELLTLPSLYGAKINQLILDGEWWRLVTPMFLHSGILHVALGFWVLLTFGPQVCKGYGSFTFFLIYILGGISGNLTSYIHTPEPTVGGTGPVFAVIGAWIIYQIQNKQATKKDVAGSMFRKAIIATALSFVLSNFGPIDDWAHLGATCVGIAYGFLICLTLQLDDSSSKTDRKNGFALVRRYADPFKSIVMFAIFIVILSTLLLFVEPQVNTLDSSFFVE